jgi:hypothetical protein
VTEVLEDAIAKEDEGKRRSDFLCRTNVRYGLRRGRSAVA